MGFYQEWAPYVPVAERRRRAQKLINAGNKKGERLSPVQVTGRAIAQSVWGKAWCNNLESYSDYENRLPRGRTYLRNGSVIDLKIGPGMVRALVQGSDLYRVQIEITAVAPPRWQEMTRRCAGALGSLVELLAGRVSREVMAVVTERGKGLFPTPVEIEMSCSCPDWATMCKHVAATLYGVGARLDAAPELLFALRKVDPAELIFSAGRAGGELPLGGAAREQVLDGDAADLGALFGIDLGDAAAVQPDAAAPQPSVQVMPEPAAKTQVKSKTRNKLAPAPVPKQEPKQKAARARKAPSASASSASAKKEQVAAMKALLRRLQKS